MTRNLKALALALVAVLAMSAVVASGASANTKFHSDSATTIITATQTGDPHVLDTTAGEVTCENTTAVGELIGQETTSGITTPSSSNCHIIVFGNTVSATVNMNGCETELTATGVVDLICPSGKSMVVTAAGCTVTIGAQSGLEEVTYSNTPRNGSTKEHITADTHLEGIDYSHSGFTCGFGSGTDGTLDGTMTMKGTDTSDNPVNIWVD